MYLSRVFLASRTRNTMLALAFPNRFHGAIEECFHRSDTRKLWRIDNLQNNLCMLILSEEKPDLSFICAQFSESKDSWESRDYSHFLDKLQNNTIWRFRLTANPTHSEPSKLKSEADKRLRGKVFAHITVDSQKQWLYKHASQHGFELFENEFTVVGTKWQHFQKGSGRSVKILSVTYEGILHIVDVNLFRDALLKGIGRGKAYGMGLLTIMRV